MTENFLSVNVTKTHYYKLGQNKPPIVVIHPFLADASTWIAIDEFLAQEFTVYTPDLPGYGQTEIGNVKLSLKGYSDFIADFIGALGLKNYSVCGVSMGGAILTYARPKIDQDVVSYLLVEPLFAWHHSRVPKKEKIIAHVFTLFGNIPLSPKLFDKILNSDRWLLSILTFFNKEKLHNPEKASQLLARFRTCHFDVFRKILSDIMNLDLSKESFTSSKPTILAMSTHDETLNTKDTVAGYKLLYPNLEYFELPLPHDPMIPVTKEFFNSNFLYLLEAAVKNRKNY